MLNGAKRARSGIRTRTPFRTMDFESIVSAVPPSGPAAEPNLAPMRRFRRYALVATLTAAVLAWRNKKFTENEAKFAQR